MPTTHTAYATAETLDSPGAITQDVMAQIAQDNGQEFVGPPL